jgi:hypothetical protein
LNKNIKALNDYNKVISFLDSLTEKDFGITFYNRGIIKKRLGDINGSKIDFNKARELGYDPENHYGFNKWNTCKAK